VELFFIRFLIHLTALRRRRADRGDPDWLDASPIVEVTGFFAKFIAFTNQRILATFTRTIDRHARRRLERENVTPENIAVRIVELRKKEHRRTNDAEHNIVDWASRWIVSGHWRQQWYPSLNAYQPKWVMPYVKGPDDKPLKPPRAKVFAVVR
jgi:hypothetical protein